MSSQESVVITGIKGFIGSHLRKACKSIGYKVYGTTREDNIGNTIKLLNSVKPALIFHTAAELSDESKMFATNTYLTQAILEYCKLFKPERLIIFGSSSEYGRKQGPISETDLLEPETIYEGTKAAATLLARSYSLTYKIPTIVIRPFAIYGPGEKPERFIQILLRIPEKIHLSEGVHDYVYIDDFISATLKIVASCKKQFDIVNIGSGVQTTNLEVVQAVERITRHSFIIEKADAKPYDSSSWVCDTSYLRSEYDIQINTSLDYGLKSTIRELYNGAHH